MGMTIIEKILARASGAKKVSPGDLVVVDVDTAVFIDNAFLPASWREVLKVHDPSKIVVIEARANTNSAGIRVFFTRCIDFLFLLDG